jgi:hypothetical protein
MNSDHHITTMTLMGHEERIRNISVLQRVHFIIIIIIIISCHRFSFFPGTSLLEPVVNPTTQASSLSL